MALKLPSLELVDPFGGVRDLHASVLATPGSPEASFSDDPLRMMRAARFASQLGVSVRDDVRDAMTGMAERIKHHFRRAGAGRTGQADVRRPAANGR